MVFSVRIRAIRCEMEVSKTKRKISIQSEQGVRSIEMLTALLKILSFLVELSSLTCNEFGFGSFIKSLFLEIHSIVEMCALICKLINISFAVNPTEKTAALICFIILHHTPVRW